MLWLPTPRFDTVMLTTPFAALVSAGVPRVVVCPLKRSVKVTVPVGLAATVDPGLVTLMVAVKVTGSPDCEGLPEVVTAVVVEAAFTVWVRLDRMSTHLNAGHE